MSFAGVSRQVFLIARRRSKRPRVRTESVLENDSSFEASLKNVLEDFLQLYIISTRNQIEFMTKKYLKRSRLMTLRLQR